MELKISHGLILLGGGRPHQYASAYNQCSFLSLLMVGAYGTIYKRQNADKTLTLKKIYVYASERSERAYNNFCISHSKTAISFNILLVFQKLCRYK